jgi:integrase
MGLGPYPEITLAKAIEKAREAKEQIRQGIDPVEEKKAVRRALKRSQDAVMTFRRAAEACHVKKMSEFKNEKHGQDWISSIKRYAFPVIGNIPVHEVELDHILKILEPIWTEKTETATRLRQRLEAVLAWATVSGYRTGDNPARWRGHLDAILPKPSKVKTVNHFKALEYEQIGAFMAALRKRKGQSARCLEFIILTACRSGEARFAVWDEIDFKKKLWHIPGERTKTGAEHTVTLTEQAIRLLESLPRMEGNPLIFSAPRGGPLSDMSVSAVLRRMKVDAVPHGMRATFRTWAEEQTNFPGAVAEKCLGHALANGVEKAYRRGELLEKRRLLMTAWANYCDKVKKDEPAKVVPMKKAKGV